MNRIFISLLILSFFIASCNLSGSHKKEKAAADSAGRVVLERVLASKKLRAASDYGYINYLFYRGEPIGYQYELLKNFAKYLDVELEIVIDKDLDDCINKLNKDEVDLIGMGLTETRDRNKILEFTDPILITKQVLVQRKPEFYDKLVTFDDIEFFLFNEPFHLHGKTIYIEKGSEFAEKLKLLAAESNDSIIILEEDKDVEELIRAVAKGEIDYTIADKHIALVNSLYYPNLDVSTPVSFPQKISWAAKLGDKRLTDTINFWLDLFNETEASKDLYNKYFKNIRPEKIAQIKKYTFTGKGISPYDDLIKEAAKIIGWDWRLLASMIYQESEFKPYVKSWLGAFGLMQMMPSTLKEYGLDETASPEQQIHAGARYLGYLDSQLAAEIADSSERIKFNLAAYNSGYSHIYDARRLAVKYGKDPNIWTDHVDFFVKNLSDEFYYRDTVVKYGYFRGEETYKFVMEVVDRYEEYKKIEKK